MLDPSFGVGGVAYTQVHEAAAAEDLVEDKYGRLVAVGGYRSASKCSGTLVTRFSGSGVPSDSFGGPGFDAGPPVCETGSAVALGKRGGVIVGGSKFCQSTLLLSCRALALRLTPNGNPASSWRFGRFVGRRTIFNGNPGPGSSGLLGRDVSIDSRGRIVLAGESMHGQKRSSGFVMRFKANGESDRTFAGSSRTKARVPGMIMLPASGRGGFDSVKALGSGRILAGGTQAGRLAAYQVLNSGRPDPNFGKNGLVTIDLDGSSECGCSFGSAMVRDYHRRILLSGGEVSDGVLHPVLVRLKASGQRDSSFGQRGIVRLSMSDFFIKSLAIQPDGRIVAVGSLDQFATIARFLPSGAADKSFFGDGTTSLPGATAKSVIIDRMGRIVVSGEYETGGFQLVRYLSH